MIYVTDNDAREWSRMAQAAYRADRNEVGHRYSMGSACLHKCEIPARLFYAYQGPYRAWLVFGEWPTDAQMQEMRSAAIDWRGLAATVAGC